MDATRGTRKSHSSSGCRNWGDEPSRRAVHVDRHVVALFGLHLVQGLADLEHGLVAAVHGRAHDRDHPDGVLVALGRGLGAAQVQPPRHHGHEAGLDLPVAAELLPAHLDVGAHHQVRPGRVLPGRLAPGPPATTAAPSRRACRPRSTRVVEQPVAWLPAGAFHR